jgi:hypothetical protein
MQHVVDYLGCYLCLDTRYVCFLSRCLPSCRKKAAVLFSHLGVYSISGWCAMAAPLLVLCETSMLFRCARSCPALVFMILPCTTCSGSLCGVWLCAAGHQLLNSLPRIGCVGCLKRPSWVTCDESFGSIDQAFVIELFTKTWEV